MKDLAFPKEKGIFKQIEELEGFLDRFNKLNEDFANIFGELIGANLGISVREICQSKIDVSRMSEVIRAIKMQIEINKKSPDIFREIIDMHKLLASQIEENNNAKAFSLGGN